jgi:putative SOS response-associated peptidase YedK
MARAVGDLLAEFDAGLEEEVHLPPSWNVAPTDDVPIVLERLIDGGQVRQLHVARWGLVPSWAKDPGVGARMINARSETVLEKPAFRKAMKSRRCAVPADGYYEWKQGAGKAKQPYYVHPGNSAGLVFAGLYEWWKDPSKGEGEPGGWVLSTSILTADTPPPGAHGQSHHGVLARPAGPGPGCPGGAGPCRSEGRRWGLARGVSGPGRGKRAQQLSGADTASGSIVLVPPANGDYALDGDTAVVVH